MTNEKELLRKYEGLRRTAKRIFGSQFGEDVAQESALRILEGKNIKQRNYYAIIDAADSRSIRAYSRRSRAFEPSQPNAEWDESQIVYGDGSGTSNESEKRHREIIFNFVHLVSKLKEPRLIEIMVLHESYEWTLKEISFCFGVSESRISQRYSLAKKLLKKIAIREGLSPCEQEPQQQTSSRALSQEIEIIESLSSETLSCLEVIQRTQDERKSELAKRAFFKIPKAVFGFVPKNQIKNKREMPRMAKIKLEGKSFICPRMEKKTINLWIPKSNY